MDLLRHLSFFTAVADARHFGHAAQDLGMTQPPLSQGIQRLERHLGVQLFDRDARGVRLTEAGERLLPGARDLLQRRADLLGLAAQAATPTRVRLGLAADLEGIAVATLEAITAQGYPAAPWTGASVELVQRVLDGELDLAVIRHPGVVDGLHASEVIRVPTILTTPVGESGDLATCILPVVSLPRFYQPSAHDQLVDELRRAGHRGDVVEAADSTQRAALVAAGLAVRLEPNLAGPVSNPPLRLRVVWPRRRSQRPGVEHTRYARLITEAVET